MRRAQTREGDNLIAAIIDTGVNVDPGRVEVVMAAIVEPDVATYQQYIDGEWAGAEDGRSYPVINPSTEEVMAVAPASSSADARRAVAAARRSFDAGEWRLKSQLQRTQIMFQIAEHLQEVSEDWGLLESQNAGAALRKTSVVDVPLAIE